MNPLTEQTEEEKRQEEEELKKAKEGKPCLYITIQHGYQC